MANPLRVIIWTRVSDIPGDFQARHITLGEALCSDLLSRKFDAIPRPTIYDHVHIPADFDSDLPLKRWFVFDLNVTEPLSPSEATKVPHLVYLASHPGDEWVFVQRDVWTERARSRAASFVWGGRSEQKLVAEMRNQSDWLQRTTHDAC